MKYLILISFVFCSGSAYCQDSTLAEIKDIRLPHSSAHISFLAQRHAILKQGHDSVEAYLKTQPKWKDSLSFHFNKVDSINKIDTSKLTKTQIAALKRARMVYANRIENDSEQEGIQKMRCGDIWNPYSDKMGILSKQNHIVGDMHEHFYYPNY